MKVNESSDHSNAVQQNIIKQAYERENEYTILVSELEKVREIERRLIIDKERLSSEVKKNEVLIQNQGKQVEMMVRQKEEMLKEIRDLRNELSKTKT